jgi:hypothetical protein
MSDFRFGDNVVNTNAGQEATARVLAVSADEQIVTVQYTGAWAHIGRQDIPASRLKLVSRQLTLADALGVQAQSG